ncbi:MAG: helix-turn-helix transcriptional regulator [Clostridia bacterium]|nr:helix-turn-helix transcriptional regulator [Clostridia bacterium]MBQ7907786.1 helix-turn-helix transcriptional regulator [Clostridia bacterium]
MQNYRLKDMREDSDKTQEEIATILGIKRQQYARYESGLQEIPLHHLITLAKYYNVSLDYLTGLIVTPKPLI